MAALLTQRSCRSRSRRTVTFQRTPDSGKGQRVVASPAALTIAGSAGEYRSAKIVIRRRRRACPERPPLSPSRTSSAAATGALSLSTAISLRAHNVGSLCLCRSQSLAETPRAFSRNAASPLSRSVDPGHADGDPFRQRAGSGGSGGVARWERCRTEGGGDHPDRRGAKLRSSLAGRRHSPKSDSRSFPALDYHPNALVVARAGRLSLSAYAVQTRLDDDMAQIVSQAAPSLNFGWWSYLMSKLDPSRRQCRF